MSRALLLAGLLTCVVAAALLRTAALDNRVAHGDEAVHFYKFNQLYTDAGYRYDPHEYHGPTLYYATLPVAWLRGARDWRDLTLADFRLVTVLFGVATVLLPLLLVDALGRSATLLAAALLALSTPLTFYSRYYIQETLLAFFMLAAIGCAWRMASSGRLIWAILFGASLGLAHATKETVILALVAACAAWLIAWMRKGDPRGAWRALCMRPRFLLGAGACAILVSAVCHSQAFRDPAGVWNSLRTYADWFGRADGAGLHRHGFGWYLGLLAYSQPAPGPRWSEALLLAASALGLFVAWHPRPSTVTETRPHADLLHSFLAGFCLLLTLTYSLIPYKTPWCVVQIVVPLCLLGGLGLAALLRGAARGARAPLTLGLIALLLFQGRQARRAALAFPGDDRNPWVYAHPSRGVERLTAYLDKLSAVHPDGREMLIAVVADNAWPLPWYLRGFERVGYWESDPPTAPVVIRVDVVPPADAASGDRHVSYYGLRRDVAMSISVSPELRSAFVERERAAAGAAR